ETMDGRSFRDRAQYILDLGAQGVWGECAVYEYAYAGPGSSYHPANDVQAIMIGELTVTRELYDLIIKKVDSTNPNKGLSGARFKVASENGAYSKEVVTGSDGTVTVSKLEAGTYAVTELEAPEGYEIDNAGPQYVVLPNGANKIVTVTFSDTPEITGEGSIRKVDADDPTKGLAGAVIKITGVDNDFTGTYITGAGGYLTDVPWDTMPIGSFVAEEVTPPEGYTKSPDINKTKQTFVWDGKTDVALVFENDAKVKVRLIKLDDSGNPLPGAVFNIVRDGQIIGTEETKADGSITVTDVTEGMYAFVEVSVPAPWATLTEPVIAHVDQATVNGGGTVTVTASDKRLPSLTILKRDAQTGDVIPNTHFEIRGIHYGYHNDVTTGPDGRAVLSNIPVDSYEVTEKSVPDPYVVGDEPTQTIWLGAGDSKELVFDNLKQPVLKISKVEQGTNTPIPGTVFTVEGIDSDYRQDVTTEADGFATLRVAPGSYRVTEKSVPEPYCLPEDEADRTQTISLNGGDDKTLIFKNSKKPLLTLSKIDADTGVPVPGTVLTVEGIDSDYKDDWRTGPDGTVALRVDPGTYRITEKSVPAPYYLPDKDADRVQTISLNPGDEKTVVFRNHKTPELTIFKEDSVAGAPIEGAKFRVTYTSNGEAAGAPASMDFGIFVTDASGQIKLHEKGKKLYPGEYTVTEVEPAPGFQMKEPLTQKVILHGGESKTLTFFNEPLNAIVVEKYDSVTHEALPGCTFQLKYLGGTSGTGGTVIGTKVTGKNGTAIWTGLTAGTYIVEEIDPADGYSIINASETVYISDKGEQNVVTVSFDNAPDGILLIRKVCATNPSVTLQNAEFKVMYADGTLIGDSNGIYRSDENGEIRIPGLKPGKSVVVTEVRAPAGFLIDTQSQTIQIQAGKTVSLTFKNQPKGSLIIQKRDSQTNEVLPGAEFRITTAAGCEVGLDGVIGSSTLTQNGLFTTDSNGEIRITNLAPGAYVLTETKAPAGYVIDTPSTNLVIGQGGDTQTVVIKNTRKGGLIIEKYDSVTRQPLAGAQFKVMTANGELTPDNEGMTSSNGLYTTDVNGQIVLSKLLPGTYVVSEEKAPDNYRKDPTPQTVVVNAGDTQTIRFYDDPLCTLTILKRDAVTKKPLRGAEFMVRDSSGHVIGPNSGLYTTGTDGTVTVTGLAPNSTVVVSEKKAPNGYVLDETPKNIVVRSGVANTLIFDDEPGTTLIIRKFIEGTENEPLSGVAFKVVDGNGGAVGPDDGIYYTDKAGEIVLEGIEPGTTVKVREIKTVEGFVLDGTPQDILIKGGEVQQLTFWNKRAGTLVIQKKDSVSGAFIAGAQFQLTYANGGYVDNDNGHLSSNGLYTTDDKGEIRINGITGTVVVKETKPAPGYVIDQSTQTQTVTVNPLDTQTLTFLNEPLCSLTLTKLDSVTGKPIPGTEFTVKDGSGTVLGRYTTGKDGTVTVTGLVPGSTVVVTETKVPSGYVLNSTPQTIIVKNGSNSVNSGTVGGTTNGNTGGTTNPGGTTNVGGGTNGGNDLTFENDPKTRLVIEKYITGTTTPLKGVTFLVTESNGQVLGSANGEYVTDENGRIVIEGLEPGKTIIAKEIRTLDGYLLDTTPKTIQIKVGDAQTLKFYNTPVGGLELIKVNEADKSQRIPNTTFEIRRMDGGLVDTITTDKQGRAHLDLDAGDYYAVEIEAGKGFELDATPTYFTVRDGKATTVTVTNRAVSGILIHKVDSVTKQGIYGVTFLLYDANKNPIGQYSSDDKGYVHIDDLPGSGRYYLRELENDGYLVDTQLKTVYVTDGTTTEITWENTAVTGQIQITKTSEDYNSMNGWPAGTPIPGTEFEIYHYRTGNLVDTIRTDKNGVAVSKPLPLGRYKIVESKAADFYGLDKTPIEVEIEHAGQIVKTAMTNKALYTNVSIKKTGFVEVMPGQQIRYDFSGIANNSTTALTSFYWRDTLPTQAVRLDKIVTGTYNVQGNYKIVFKTNLNGEYRTMYDNLSTMQNHVLDASPAALGLASNEYVTEFMVSFGIVPGNFRQVEVPKVYCNVVSWLTGGTQFVNQADVGGVYNGQWIMATSRWVTRVYKPAQPLPRTGY
uniref:SpaA isopeptide-forming pilin-related protein n=1 Tax=Flintibacter muris TaxID=2941327 RepID=UPI00203C4AEA